MPTLDRETLREIVQILKENKRKDLIDILQDARLSGKQIFIMGNGGSASTASHFVCDLAKNTKNENWPHFKVIGLTDNMEIFSAYANDDGYENVFSMQLENIKRVKPDAVLIWANAKESALVLYQMREMGMNQPVYASDRAVSDEFLKLAGDNAEGVVTTSPYNPEADLPQLKAFQQSYRERFGKEADVYAAHAYDGMNLIVKAIDQVGLNRVLIRDILSDLETFQGYMGVTGEIIFDESWNDIGEIWMARVKNGVFEYSPSPLNYERGHTSRMPGY